MSVLAIIPARAGSKGIRQKNFRSLGGRSLIGRAVDCAKAVGCLPVVSSDAIGTGGRTIQLGDEVIDGCWPLARPSDLAQDDTPMIAVVQHVLEAVPEACSRPSLGDPIVLLQPTQPFRQPKHIQAALDLLESSGADSVVSVVALPASHNPHSACVIEDNGQLLPFWSVDQAFGWEDMPQRRQDVIPAYRRDGTVYAFWRKTIERYGTLYGADCRPLIIPPEESCELDTEADWTDVERRWRVKEETS